MDFISLFAGIDGFGLGFERAGMNCVLQVEKDKNCLKLLNRKWPNVLKIEDVKDVNKQNTPPASLVCGGFPCQDVSIAGNREGLAGKRSGLWFEFLRIIEELKPEWVVIENVPGLLSSNGGRDMGAVVGGLAECGYWWAYRCIDAQYFGVPQRRRRVFIVASLTRGHPQQVLFEPKSSPWDTAPGRETGPGFARTFTIRTGKPGGGKGYLESKSAMTLGGQPQWLAFGGNNTAGASEMAPAVNAHGSRRYDFESEAFICNTFNGYTGGADDNDAQGNHLVIGFDSSRGQYTGDIAAPLRVNGAKSPGVNDGKPDNMCVSLETGIRRLTPLECERLQGFPDHFTAGQSDSVRYRQLGNAVAVPVTEWLGKRIMLVENS